MQYNDPDPDAPWSSVVPGILNQHNRLVAKRTLQQITSGTPYSEIFPDWASVNHPFIANEPLPRKMARWVKTAGKAAPFVAAGASAITKYFKNAKGDSVNSKSQNKMAGNSWMKAMKRRFPSRKAQARKFVRSVRKIGTKNKVRLAVRRVARRVSRRRQASHRAWRNNPSRLSKYSAYKMQCALVPWHENINSGPLGVAQSSNVNSQHALGLYNINTTYGAVFLPQNILATFTNSKQETGSSDIPLTLFGTWLIYKQAVSYSVVNRGNTRLFGVMLFCTGRFDQETAVTDPLTDWQNACANTQQNLAAAAAGSTGDRLIPGDKPWFYSNWTQKWKIIGRQKVRIESGDAQNFYVKQGPKKVNFDRLSTLYVMRGVTIFPLLIAYGETVWDNAANTMGPPITKLQIGYKSVISHKILPLMQQDTVNVVNNYTLLGGVTGRSYNPYSESVYTVETN